jgi:S-adenosylmethionine:tRNA ribosyltransferase-isomerase
MSPATAPPETREQVKLLLVDPARGPSRELSFDGLPELLVPGDLLVFNDAATLPASLAGELADTGGAIELRLVGPGLGRRWRAVAFGAGDWQLDTDARPSPPPLEPGTRLRLRGGLEAKVAEVEGRLVELAFEREDAELYAGLYAAGRPVQYSHLEEELELWSVQTLFAGRPWAVEMPSAGRPFTAAILAALRRRGVAIARLTHAAGLSATGDPELDAALPLPEPYEIPAETVELIARTKTAGGRVIAVGTSVVRALESAVEDHGELRSGRGLARLILSPAHELRVVDGLLTGMHDPSESHYRLLGAFASERTLQTTWCFALGADYRSHEFGDLALLLPPATAAIAEPARTVARQVESPHEIDESTPSRAGSVRGIALARAERCSPWTNSPSPTPCS